MRGRVFFLSIFLAVLCGATPVNAQAPNCRQGTLADVLGTSCTVGKLILNFQNDYQGSCILDDGATTIPIDAGSIGFIPIHQGDQDGFKLVLNFTEGPGPDHTIDSEHLVQFSCLPQAAPGFDIRDQGLNADFSVNSPVNDATVSIVESQLYHPEFGGSPTQSVVAQVIFGGQIFPINVINARQLNIPAPFSAGAGSPSLPTMQMTSFADGSSTVALNSASFLFTIGRQIPPPPLASLTYTNIDIPGVATSVSGINNAGVMVGSFEGTDPNSTTLFDTHAFVRDAAGGITIIDLPGALLTIPGTINDLGDVAGSIFGDPVDGSTHGFILHNGVFQPIVFPGATSTFVGAINNNGDLVGQFQDSQFNVHGFLFSDGQFTVLDLVPLVSSNVTIPTAINNKGVIAGTVLVPDTFRGFTLKNDLFRPFDVPDQGQTNGIGFNDGGDIVGWYIDANGVQHGYLRTSQPQFFTVDFPGGDNIIPLGINAQGTIVGTYHDANGPHSFRADPILLPDDGTVIEPETSAVPLPYTPAGCMHPRLRPLAELLHNNDICRPWEGKAHP
jgi:probable HAF family extracellular repeat protein